MNDPFTEGQRQTELQREMLEVLREDVRAVVQEEVANAAMSRSELDRTIREAVTRERSRRPGGSVLPQVRPAVVAVVAVVGLVVGVAGGILGYRFLASPSGDAVAGAGVQGPAGAETTGEGPAADDVAGTETAGSTSPDAAATTPEARAARYETLFEDRAPELAAVVERLEAAGPVAEVSAAAAAWREGSTTLTAGQQRRLHDALVQLAVSEETGANLTLDGLLQRDPCRGNSCGALLELWQTRGAELGMPPLPEEPASATDALAVAERALVLRLVEAGDG